MKLNNELICNPAQRCAIEHTTGPACVIAGPGSGKTFVIIQRIISLIRKGVDPGTILTITFTKAAATEMQHRFIKETDSRYPEVMFGTFHSCFFQILNSCKNYGDKKLTLISEPEKYKLLNHILLELKLRIRSEKRNKVYSTSQQIPDEIEYSSETIRLILSEISRLKNDGSDYSFFDKNVPLCEYFHEIATDYSDYMSEHNLIDFDDMVILCHRMLKDNPDMLRNLQKRFRYIQIDEYQDINRMQFEVVRLLLGEDRNLFVVGDDDQSIYGFRGSRPELMLEFKNIYTDAKLIILDINYRCAKSILDSSVKVIEENRQRFAKDIKAGDGAEQGKVVGEKYEDKLAQYKSIISDIKTRENLSEVAVIFRTNLEATAMARILAENSIPCSYKERVVSVSEKPAVKTILAYLSFAHEGQKRSDFLRIMNEPVRYFTRKSATSEIITETELTGYYIREKKPDSASKAQKFFKDINMLKRLRPKLAVHFIRNYIGYDKYIKEKFRGSPAIAKAYMEDLDEFEKISAQFVSYKELRIYLDELNAAIDALKESKTLDKKGVRVMTIHGSKGLEFPVVYLPDLNEGIIPSRKSITPEAIEEERRMLYVAMTRAKKELHLCYVEGTKENPMRMSRFLRPVNILFNN